MGNLEDWLSFSTNLCIRRWRNHLNGLGASWDTFRREKDEVINDLTSGGIPRLAACDIFSIVREELRRSEIPLAVFWDLDSMSVPAGTSHALVVTRLKSILASQGKLVVFRAYTGFRLVIDEVMRSQLQLAGCDLVDASNDRANNYIIVDSMKFAFMNLERATICFVSSNIEPYLLINLQKPEWKTVLVSNDDPRLQTYCDTIVNWDEQVLQLHRFLPPPGFTPTIRNPPINTLALRSADPRPVDTFSRAVGARLPTRDPKPALSHGHEDATSLPVSNEEIKLLRTIVKANAHVGHDGDGTLKCQVGSMLRTTYPKLFPGRASIQNFLNKAVAQNIIIETEEAGLKLLYMPEDFSTKSSMRISSSMPITISEVPKKVKDASRNKPIIIFLKKSKVPKGGDLPKTFIQSIDKFMILMFRSEQDVQRAAESRPWILLGTIIDWRLIHLQKNSIINVSKVETFECPLCSGVFKQVDSFKMLNSVILLCRNCFKSSDSWTESEKSSGVKKTLFTLEMLEKFDDIFVRSSLIRKIMFERWSNECASRGQAALWVEEAVERGLVKESKMQLLTSKSVKYNYLARNSKWLDATHQPPQDLSTALEEAHIVNLLWEERPYFSRKEIASILKAEFPHMDNPMIRNKVFINAVANGSFFIAKGPYGQVVALTQEDATRALELTREEENYENENTSGDGSHHFVDSTNEIGTEMFDIERLLYPSQKKDE